MKQLLLTIGPMLPHVGYGVLRSLRGGLSKKSTFLKNWHPVCGPMSFVAKGKNKEKK